jgi:hypothetical protein
MAMSERHGEDFFKQAAPEQLDSLFDCLLLADHESQEFADCLQELSYEAYASGFVTRDGVEKIKTSSEAAISATTTAVIFGFAQDDASFDDKMRLAHELVESDEILRMNIYAKILGKDIGDEPLEIDAETFHGYHTYGIDNPENSDALEAIVSSILSDYEVHMRSDLNIFIGNLLFDDSE